jgi:hypothetical protein
MGVPVALDTITDYCAEARVLLQDVTNPVRYSDEELISALQMGLMEARKLRPDLFLGTTPGLLAIPDPTATGNQLANVDVQYRVPLLYYMVGHCFMRDEEEGSGNRSAEFHQRFIGKMLALAA